VDNFRVPDSSLQGNASTKRIAQNIGFFKFKMLHQFIDVVGHQIKAERPVDIGSLPMGL
jgi:hypothetical protein